MPASTASIKHAHNIFYCICQGFLIFVIGLAKYIDTISTPEMWKFSTILKHWLKSWQRSVIFTAKRSEHVCGCCWFWQLWCLWTVTASYGYYEEITTYLVSPADPARIFCWRKCHAPEIGPVRYYSVCWRLALNFLGVKFCQVLAVTAHRLVVDIPGQEGGRAGALDRARQVSRLTNLGTQF